MTNTPLLELKNIRKVFPGVIALDDVSLTIYEGEVVALLGENGAGKSTLMKVLSGAYQRDGGEIYISSKQISKHYTPRDAKDLGIGIIYQELSLVSELSVAENIFLTREPRKVKSINLVDYKKMFQLAKEQLEKLDVSYIDVKAKIGSLPLPERQMVEIAKALSQNCSVIIMDEPTTSLTWEETLRLFDVINSLKKQGVAVIYISHRLAEIFEICDRATVMRDGKVVGDCKISETNQQEIISMMTGRNFTLTQRAESKSEIQDNKILFSAQKMSDGKMIKNVTFDVHQGEVLGIGGLIGAQRTELMRIIAGVDKAKSGKVFIGGQEVNISSPVKATKGMIGYLSENRKEEGLNLGLTISENIILSNFGDVCNAGLVNKKKVSETGNKYISSLKIKGRAGTIVGNLSGGNQQKVAISKWLNSGCRVLIFDEPTRGIDVAAKTEIHDLIRKFSQQGNAAIVVSSEVNELVAVSDRILVMSHGEIVSEIFDCEISQDRVMYDVTSSGGKKHE